MFIRTALTMLLALLTVLPASWAQADEQRLFVNLTSDHPLRAGMAVGQATRAREMLKIPVTVFLSVEGVRLADTRLPSPIYPTGQSVRKMLEHFMAVGGEVLICPMCMENVGGIPKEALLKGVRLAGPKVTFPALFAEGTRTLSY